MLRVSVIIPTYNREKYVVKAIDSVLNQSFKDYEIIVIDDGSIDNTRIVLQHYMNKIHYIYQQNSGVSAARNAGIRQAKGEWIAFLDSDDEWMEEYLAKQMDHARQFPRAVAHITNCMWLDGATVINWFMRNNLLPKFGQEQSLVYERPFCLVMDHWLWSTPATIMRRDILLQTPLFPPQLSIAEDMDVVARMALKGPFTISKEILVRIYRRQESLDCLSSQYMKRGIYSRKAFGEAYSHIMQLPDLTFREKRTLAKELSTTWRVVGNLLLKTGRKSEARPYYWESLVLNPSVRSLAKYLAAFLPQQISVLLVRKGRDILPEEN